MRRKQLSPIPPTASVIVLAALGALALLGPCAGAGAGPRILLPNDPEGDGVRAAAKAFYEKLADGDAAGAKAMFDGPADQSALLDAYLRFVTATERLRHTMGAKFGDAAGERTKEFAGSLVRVRAEQVPQELISINADLASVATLSALNCGSDLRRIGGEWKVTHLTTQRPQTRAMTRFLDAAADAADEIRGQIDSGKLADAEAAVRALDERARPALQAFLSPSAAGRPPTTAQAEGPIAPPATAPAAAPAFGAAEVRELIGMKFASPQVQKLIDRMPGAPHLGAYQNGPSGSLYVSSPELGLSLLFLLPEGKLRTAFLMAEGEEGYARFGDELSDGLTLSDTRRDVERKLGAPPQSGGGWTSHYVASYPGRGIHVEYASDAVGDPGIRIAHIALSAPLPEPAKPATRPATGSPRLTVRLVAPEGKPDDAAEPLPTLDSSEKGEKLYVRREALLDQADVAELGPTAGESGKGLGISMKMTPAGARRLGEVTRANIGKRLAVVFDGVVLIAPTIRSTVSDAVVIDFGASTPGEERSEIIGRLHAALTALPGAAAAAATSAPAAPGAPGRAGPSTPPATRD